MKHVFIAVGGSGTKVAEALVRLLAVGFPTRKDENGNLTSAGDSLEIWRVDPDRSSGSAEDLNQALQDYRKIQSCLNDNDETRTLAQSQWGMDIETNVRHLDPLDLPQEGEQDNVIKTLRGVLDSRHSRGGQSVTSSVSLLAPFYETKDLDVQIDRGFYQKPFIGSAVMSIFAKSLEDDATPGGRAAGLTGFSNTPTNFFLCGSLHGGTGACGVPVMASFLKKRKDQNTGWGWRIGGCLLAPYVTPPNPPFSSLEENTHFNETDVGQYIERYGNEPAFTGMTPEEKQELVRQILQGFYADPEDMEARAKQGLAYYRDHSADYFDELYLVGKPNPNKLKTWSNGGATQRNPLNSAEVVSAISAFNFFAKANTGNPKSYVIGSSLSDISPVDMRLSQLPTYKVGGTEIDAEKVFLASALLHHLVVHQIPWQNVRASTKDFDLCKFYDDKESRISVDEQSFAEALRLIAISLQALIRGNNEQFPTGWSGMDVREMWKFLASDDVSIKDVEQKLAKKMFGDDAKGTVALGNSAAKFTTQNFGKWCPEGDQFTRGDYLRHVWSKLSARCQTQLGV
ncbi:MAG TPA: hypothetical protein PLL77_16100 [Pyrinomonadaceae bacterium]|nr:hypothetical protein [Pyrinomonadaceae bacterium]